MSDKLFIPVLLGTNREGRMSEHVAKFLVEEIKKRDDMATQLFDVAEFDLPKVGYGGEIKDQFPEYRDAIIKADGLIVVAPEYNHGYPGRLKSVMDLLLQEYIHKAVGLVGVSAGGFGGTRVIEALVPMVRELGLAVTFSDLTVSKVQTVFDEQGKLKDEAYIERAEGFLAELAWLATVLRYGREKVPSKHHQ